MLGDSTMVESSAEEAAAAAAAAPNSGGILLEGGSHEIGMVGSNNSGGTTEEDKAGGINRVNIDESERSFGGNRWPRQETLALLKIRSDMDAAFRDSSLKGPLWEQVSRKLAELGYHRSAKKCKEKFENVYKYHKRTKDGRSGKSEGKTYRFFDQLEALQNLHSLNSLSPPKPQTPTPISAAMPWSAGASTNVPTLINVPQTNAATAKPISINPTNNNISTQAAVPIHSINPSNNNSNTNNNNIQSSILNISSNLFSTSTSSSTASDEDLDHDHQGSRNKKKRKWKEFFRRLTKEVIEKQEELQNKFLKTVERCEQERIAREEAWRVQEIARINREQEILVQERSTAAAKHAAVIAFLQNISGGQQPNSTVQVQVQQPPVENPHQLPPAAPPPTPPLPQLQPPTTQAPLLNFETTKMSYGNGNNNVVLSSPSRWPKAEVEALIKLRTNLDIKYQDNGPKASLWEEISSGMRKLGYNRNAKRCKEKWENINKYFKKVKESNKVRPEDSKTCPYFHQLDAIYKDKISTTKNENNNIPSLVPLMVQPEQQWPPPREDIISQHQHQHQQQQVENVDDHQINQEDEEDDDEEEENGEDTEEEYEVNDFELVAKKIGTAE